MIAPLALLGPDDQIPPGQYTIKGTVTGEDNQNRSLEGGTFEGTDIWVRPEAPEPASTEITLNMAGEPADLSPIGLLTVPSFIVALGVFVFLRKRMS